MKNIWKKEFIIDDLNQFRNGSIVGYLDIEFLEKGEALASTATVLLETEPERRGHLDHRPDQDIR